MLRKRILFVDDDDSVLEGLRLRLRRLRDKWDMQFVDSGARAIECLEQTPFDVIVTDMRMPGMDGAELLQVASERWPQTIRIVLSGYAALEQIVRLVPYAHQYFSKPCEPLQLENLVDRCLHLHELLRRPALRAVVGRVRKLPAMPKIYAQLRSMLSSDAVKARDVAELVASDAAIAAKVLQIVNSAFFRLSRRISSIEQAVTYLGFAAIRNLTLSAEVFSQWPEQGGSAVLRLDRLQDHVQTTAAAAHSLTINTPSADDALLAGLLHDIGYWILAHECQVELARSVEVALAQKIPLHEAESQVIGASHAEIGAYLLGIWGLPYPTIEAIAHHHTPEVVTQTEFDTLAALATAHSLSPADDTAIFNVQLVPHPRVDATYLASLQAPFDWNEAARRVAESCAPKEV